MSQRKTTHDSEQLDIALKLHEMGYWIAVCDGKRPIHREWQSMRLNKRELTQRLEQRPDANVGIVLGRGKGRQRIMDVECDSPEAERAWLEMCKQAGLRRLPNTPTYTSSRGKHRLFLLPSDVAVERAVVEIDGIEFRIGGGTKGAASIMPPSVHEDGTKYKWERGKSIFQIDPAPLPKAIADLLTAKTKRSKATARLTNGDATIITQGQRNVCLASLAGTMRRRGMGEQAIRAALAAENCERCDPPLTDGDVDSIARSVSQYKPSDTNGNRLVESSPLPFPTHVFPKPLAGLIEAAGRALPCPPDHVGVPMLAALGTAIGTSRQIEIKTNWRESARVFSAIVARPGERKSPALDLATGPIRQRQIELRKEYEAARKAHKKRLAACRGKRRAPTPEEPALKQVFTTDATLESLAVLLERNPKGILFLRDELSAWVRAMNQYRGGRGSDREYWLSFWSGAQVVVNRKSQPAPIVVGNPFICVTGCIPPAVLGELTDLRGREDGFVHRILFGFPDSLPIAWTDASVSSRVLKAYEGVFSKLWRLNNAVLRLTPDGKAAFVSWAEQHYAELNGIDDRLRGAWAKLDGYCARLSLILHESRRAAGETKSAPVDKKSVEGAIELIAYFKSHARRIYRRLATEHGDKRIAGAVEWIRQRGGEVSARDIQKYKVGGVRDNAEAKALLEELEGLGHGHVQRGRHKHVEFKLTDQ